MENPGDHRALATLSSIIKLIARGIRGSEVNNNVPLALKTLQEAVALTRPWINLIEEHLSANGLSDDPKKTRSNNDAQQSSRTLRSTDAQRQKESHASPRRLRMLHWLLRILREHVRSAEKEIRRLERRFDGDNKRWRGQHIVDDYRIPDKVHVEREIDECESRAKNDGGKWRQGRKPKPENVEAGERHGYEYLKHHPASSLKEDEVQGGESFVDPQHKKSPHDLSTNNIGSYPTHSRTGQHSAKGDNHSEQINEQLKQSKMGSVYSGSSNFPRSRSRSNRHSKAPVASEPRSSCSLRHSQSDAANNRPLSRVHFDSPLPGDAKNLSSNEGPERPPSDHEPTVNMPNEPIPERSPSVPSKRIGSIASSPSRGSREARVGSKDTSRVGTSNSQNRSPNPRSDRQCHSKSHASGSMSHEYDDGRTSYATGEYADAATRPRPHGQRRTHRKCSSSTSRDPSKSRSSSSRPSNISVGHSQRESRGRLGTISETSRGSTRSETSSTEDPSASRRNRHASNIPSRSRSGTTRRKLD